MPLTCFLLLVHVTLSSSLELSYEQALSRKRCHQAHCPVPAACHRRRDRAVPADATQPPSRPGPGRLPGRGAPHSGLPLRRSLQGQEGSAGGLRQLRERRKRRSSLSRLVRKLERSLFKDASQVCCDLWEEGAETSVVIRSPVSLVPRSLWMCTRHPVSLLLFLRKHPLLLFLLAQVLSRCFPLSVSSRGEIVRVPCAQSSRRLPTAPTGSAASSPTRSQALARAWSPGANASASIP